jgi:hypothetical protein
MKCDEVNYYRGPEIITGCKELERWRDLSA